MINYPNGKPYTKIASNKRQKHMSQTEISLSCANRGMDLEDDINLSNDYFIKNNICLIYKRPTPINVVKVDYSKGAIITQAYFEEQSTTDYNGIYKGKYVDFEAKNTKSKTSFPLTNISSHQIEHLRKVIYHNGIAFLLVQFQSLNKIFLLDAGDLLAFIEKEKRKSIPLSYFEKFGVEIFQSFQPRIDYITAINKRYFSDDSNF